MMFSKLSSKLYYWHFFMGLSVFNFVLFMFATYMQYWLISAEVMPEYLAGILTQADWKAMQSATYPILSLFLFDFFITSIIPTISIGFNLIPKIWHWFQRGTACCGGSDEGTAIQRRSYLFYGMYAMIMAFLVTPLYAMLRTLSWKGIGTVQAIITMVQIVITIGVLGLVALFPRGKYLVCIASIILILMLIIGYNEFIMIPQLISQLPKPSENENSLGVFQLLRKLKFSTDRFLCIPHDYRAFTTGVMSNAVIVAGGGLIDMMTPREYEAVIAHELGHWRYNHILMAYVFASVLTCLEYMLFFFIIDRPRFYRAFGFSESKKVPLGVGVVINQMIMSQMNRIFMIGFFIFSQQCEYAADGHAAKLGLGTELISALKKLTLQFPAFGIRTKLWGYLVATHPDLYERATNALSYM